MLALIYPKRFFFITENCFYWNCSVQLTHPLVFANLYLVYVRILNMSTKKGKKRIKNIPVLHEEMKRQHSIMLTDIAWNKLKELSDKQKLSISELIEQWVRDTQG